MWKLVWYGQNEAFNGDCDDSMSYKANDNFIVRCKWWVALEHLHYVFGGKLSIEEVCQGLFVWLWQVTKRKKGSNSVQMWLTYRQATGNILKFCLCCVECWGMFLDNQPAETWSICVTTSLKWQAEVFYVWSASIVTAVIHKQETLMYISPCGTCPLRGVGLEFHQLFLWRKVVQQLLVALPSGWVRVTKDGQIVLVDEGSDFWRNHPGYTVLDPAASPQVEHHICRLSLDDNEWLQWYLNRLAINVKLLLD
jgi:hypothetical protein